MDAFLPQEYIALPENKIYVPSGGLMSIERYNYILYKGLEELCDKPIILNDQICFYDKIKRIRKPFLIIYLKSRNIIMLSRLIRKNKMSKIFKNILIQKNILIHNSFKKVRSNRDGGYERLANFENTCNIIDVGTKKKYKFNSNKVERKRVYDISYKELFSKYLYMKADRYKEVTIHPRFVIRKNTNEYEFDQNQDYTDTDKENHDKETENVEYLFLSKFPDISRIMENRSLRYFYPPIFAKLPRERQMELL